MKIKIRYESEYQTLEVENMELEKWLNISISEDESQEDYEQRIQDVIEERFNRPDYNKHDRHIGNAYMKSKDGTVEINIEEAVMFRAADKSAFSSSIDGVHNQLEYEVCCETLRSLLKPAVADMVIAIVLDGLTVSEYAEMQPKVSYYDLILQNKNTLPITQIAKDYGMSGRKFNELLHELGVQYKFRKTWLLYQQYAECGYTQSRTYAIDESRSVMHTYWTQKGRLFLYDLLKSEGILPVIE